MAKGNGYSDVLYLDAIENKYVEEVSSCNIFMVKVCGMNFYFFAVYALQYESCQLRVAEPGDYGDIVYMD